MESVQKLVSQKPVVIFSNSTCCMCHAIKRLFYEQGVSPMIYEVDEHGNGGAMERDLIGLGCSPSMPYVFVGGKFVGTDTDLISLHLNGSPKRMLKAAGALWL